jgi:hypothetical protein
MQSSVSLRWQPPEDNGSPVASYTVELDDGLDDSGGFRIAYVGTAPHCSIPNLKVRVLRRCFDARTADPPCTCTTESSPCAASYKLHCHMDGSKPACPASCTVQRICNAVLCSCGWQGPWVALASYQHQIGLLLQMVCRALHSTDAAAATC